MPPTGGDSSHSSIPLATFVRMARVIEHAAVEPCALIRAGLEVVPGDLGLAAEMMRVQPTLADILQRGEQFTNQVTNSFQLKSIMPDGTYHLRILPAGEVPTEDWALLLEHMVGNVLNTIECGTGVKIPLRSIHFSHAPRFPVSAYKEVLGAFVGFRELNAEILISKNVLITPGKVPSPKLAELSAERVQQDITMWAGYRSLSERLNALMLIAQGEGEWQLIAVAKAVSLSPRTLQNHLQVEGTSFTHIADQVRRGRATQALHQGQTIREISAMLGYSEPRSFHRAFRRWFNTSPETWRKKNLGWFRKAEKNKIKYL